jgi:RNA polymerase sigma-70 factor (ECF subfamily)
MKTEHAEDAGPLDDIALVTAAQHDRAAFGPLYERYVDLIYRFVYHQVGNHVDAEDVTTQVFRQARATLADCDPTRTPFGAWLAAIARDQIARRRGDEAATLDESFCDLVPLAAQAASTSDLVTALRQLPLDQQRAIVLRFSRRRTTEEIGEALNRSEDDIRQLIHRALIALRSALESK